MLKIDWLIVICTVDKFFDTLSFEDIETSYTMIGNLSSILINNKNENMKLNNKSLNNIVTNNKNAKPNLNAKNRLLKDELKKI